MSGVALGLAIDIFLLICLGMTIYYAMRLSGNLNNFKRSKEDLQALIIELSSHIDEAQIAMKDLKISGEESADKLSALIIESRELSEELKMINQSGDRLANRLESVSTSRSRSARRESEPFPDKPSAQPRDIAAGPSNKATYQEIPSFFIQDRDFEEGVDDRDAFEDDDVPEDLGSEAERELFKALKKRRTAG